MNDNDATKDWKEVELATGEKLSVPPQLLEKFKELNAGNMRQADYTQKRQKAAEWEASLAKKEADIAVARERLNQIERNPQAKAAFDALANDPFAAQKYLSGKPEQETQDPFGDTPQAPPAAGVQPGNPEVARLMAMVDGLGAQMKESQRRSADSAIEAELINSWSEQNYIEHDVIRTHLNASPHLWNLPAKEQVRSAVMAFYADKVLADARLAGRTELEREQETQKATEAAEAEKAANSPTQYTMPETGEAIPSMEELQKLVLTDPDKARPYMLEIEAQLAKTAEADYLQALEQSIPG